MKAYWGSRSIAPCILDLSTRWKGVASFMSQPLYRWGKSPWYPLDRRLGGPQSWSVCSGEQGQTLFHIPNFHYHLVKHFKLSPPQLHHIRVLAVGHWMWLRNWMDRWTN